MNRTLLPAPARLAIAIICLAACASCTYMLKFGNKPKFHPVNISGVTFTPAIVEGPEGLTLHLTTTRPNPATDQIDTIRLDDISITLNNQARAAAGDDSFAASLEQDGDFTVLLESGDVQLTGNLTAALPKGTSPNKYDMAIITYKGQSATSHFQKPVD